jgi:hypothetical protein
VAVTAGGKHGAKKGSNLTRLFSFAAWQTNTAIRIEAQLALAVFSD